MISARALKMRITHILKTLMFHLGVFALVRVLRPNRRVAILRYHAVVAPEDNDYVSPSISLSPQAFDAHVRYFARRYAVISLDDAVLALQGRKKVPKNSVVFTFDDGYADNYRAAEILKKYGATGTFYVTAGCIDRQEPFWLAEVIYLLLKTRMPRLQMELPDRSCEIKLDENTRWQAIGEIVRAIKSNNRKAREHIRVQLREQIRDISFEERDRTLLLTWEQLEKMHKMGMTIGAHTLTHLNLPNADEADAEYEIRESRALIEKKLHVPVLHFSYPNSGPYEYYTTKVRDLVAANGYASATTSFFGYAQPGDDLFSIKRVRTVPSLVETVAGLELGKLFE